MARWVVVATGCAIFAPAPVAASGRALKAMWGPSTQQGAPLFGVYRDLGTQLYETRLDWASTAPTRPRDPRDPRDPAYVWPAELSSDITQGAAAGIRVAVQLTGAPPWANGARSERWAPTHPGDFADFAYAAARRYPSVRIWMIWGEPNRAANFAPLVKAAPGRRLDAAQRAAPHGYARLLDAAYGELKAASARNLVVGGMTFTTGDIDTEQWIENLRLPNGRAPRMDLYGHNPFCSRDPNFASPALPRGAVDFSELPRLARWVDAYLGRGGRPPIRLFLSEWTIPTRVDDEFNFFVDPSVQAQWIADGLRLARSWPRIYALGWIHLYDAPPTSGGGLLDALGAKKPGYAAWQAG